MAEGLVNGEARAAADKALALLEQYQSDRQRCYSSFDHLSADLGGLRADVSELKVAMATMTQRQEAEAEARRLSEERRKASPAALVALGAVLNLAVLGIAAVVRSAWASLTLAGGK